MVFTNGSYNSQGSKICLILENEDGLVIEVSLRFKISTANNQVEYKAIIIGLTLTAKIGA